MAEYTWAFDRSFLVFLLIAFTSMALAEKLRSLIPMPFIYGVIFILGFAFDLLPKDLLLSANMIAVGTIAFNVLVVHSGTMVNFRLLRDRWRETLLCLSAFLILIVLDHLLENCLASHQSNTLSCPCYSRIQKISVEQLSRSPKQRDYHCRVFTPL